jgi:hypothetical protein
VHAAADRHSIVRRRRGRALTASFAVAVALAAAGCASDADTGSTNSPPLVTGQQVVTSCFQNYFYNGILPKSAAETNCSACVEQKLRKLGMRPSPGQNEVDLLTGVRLSSADINVLQNDCNETDASEQ